MRSAFPGDTPSPFTRDYDAQRPLLSSIETKWGSTGDPFVKYAYTHNALGQRRTATQSGTLYKDYYEGTAHAAVTRYFGYNSRGEVTSESLFYGDAVPGQPASTDELPGRRTEYRYDSIGNRRSSGPSIDEPGTPNSPNDEYTPNALNQYETKENNLVRVTGTVAAGAKVFVEGATSTALTERAWAADVLPANAESAVKVYAGKLSPDTVQTDTRTFFVPPALQTFAHDADGNLLHDSVWKYQWDAENRLNAMEHRVEVIGTGMLANADARRLEFRYDYQGRRVRKTVYGGWNGSTFDATPLSDVKFLYDGWNLVAEFRWNASTSTFDLNRSFTWGLDLAGSLTASGGVGALLQIHDYQAGKTLLPAYDGNGNVVALVNAESGTLNLEARYEYTSFGKPIRAEGDYAQSNPFRFSSKYTDSETGLAYYGYRYYSATLGRFINRDPIGEAGGLNFYAFVGNNGANNWDYLGLYDFWDLGEDGLNFFAGLGNAVSFGGSAWLARQLMSDADAAILLQAQDSGTFRGGEWASLGLGVGRLAYAGLAKGASAFYAARGATMANAAAASASRNALKRWFRLNPWSEFRVYPFATIAAKYGTPQAIIAAAGRTNVGYNAAGAVAAAGGATTLMSTPPSNLTGPMAPSAPGDSGGTAGASTTPSAPSASNGGAGSPPSGSGEGGVDLTSAGNLGGDLTSFLNRAADAGIPIIANPPFLAPDYYLPATRADGSAYWVPVYRRSGSKSKATAVFVSDS